MTQKDDLISRQDAIDVFGKLSQGKYYTNLINAIPSAEPEIVRCKDCKWKQGSECVRFAEVRPFPDDYCSRAERRTDEGD